MNRNRKIVGIGETVFDIIFKDNQPIAAKPGGSVFNALISLGRAGIKSEFISETGNDRVGDIISEFLIKNGVSNQFVYRYKTSKTALSLAFLNDKSDAEYEFYKDYHKQKIESHIPELQRDDIVMFGSFYAINPTLRHVVKSLLTKAEQVGAIIYYDPNFRKSHLHELPQLFEVINENIAYADIVRGSDEDFTNIFGTDALNELYQQISPLCKSLIVTRNSQGVDLKTTCIDINIPAINITPISTIGAGDSFNAGIVYGLIVNDVKKSDLETLNQEKWQRIIETAVAFSTNVCQSFDNYIAEDFIEKLNQKNK